MRIFALLATCLSLAAPNAALAWTRPGHMVTAAIAYDELAARDPEALRRLLELAAPHPDRGPFEVAIGRSTGQERDQQIFMELARWPDDIRGGPHDHPTWHYALAPVVAPDRAPPSRPSSDLVGAADEAFALNVKVASDRNAPAADRALALAWIFHIAGDIHQPLHAAQLFSTRFPAGDRGGALQYVKDPQTGAPISLHWLWDDSVNRDGEAAAALDRAEALMASHPRASFPELRRGPAQASEFGNWRKESYALAEPLVYGKALATADQPAQAPAQSPAYLAAMNAAAERRLVLAGYRLADIAAALVSAPR